MQFPFKEATKKLDEHSTKGVVFFFFKLKFGRIWNMKAIAFFKEVPDSTSKLIPLIPPPPPQTLPVLFVFLTSYT